MTQKIGPLDIFKLIKPRGAAAAARPAPRRESPTLPHLPAPAEPPVTDALARARDWLLSLQNDAGYWVAELEADTTVESYFILFRTFMGRHDDPRIPKYAKTIRSCMLPQGGWAAYENGPPDLSASVLSYFALKVAGISADEEDMRRATAVILNLGGIANANTYTKFYLAFFGQYDWSHVPAVPPEMILLPSKIPINIYSISSWARAIFVPMSILYALKPVCAIPPECGVDELIVGGRENADLSLPRPPKVFSWSTVFLLTDKALKMAERFPIALARKAAIRRAERWMLARFERSGGLGAILPGMVNSIMALRCLGYPDDHPAIAKGLRDLEALEIHDPEDDSIRVQPCHSPVWDTAISTYALAVSGATIESEPRLRASVPGSCPRRSRSRATGRSRIRRRPAAGTSSSRTSSIPMSTTRSWC